MLNPIGYRFGIPFYYDKSESDFRQDRYERYDPMVIRQSMLHLADHMWGRYPMQGVVDYIRKNSSTVIAHDILEIGCGVGRMIGDIATNNPDVQCWGIDYSYQMLKQAKEVWIDGNDVQCNPLNFGFVESIKVDSKSLTNLSLGLARGEALPFSDMSQDLIISSFLIDRLSDPIQCLSEMKRVLRPNGKIIIVTPFNFINATQWEQLYPLIKFQEVLKTLDFEILDWVENILIHEPLDRRGNEILWNCIGMVLK